MTYDQMVIAANANFNKLAANNPNASKERFDKFPLEIRLVMDYKFFTSNCI